MTKKSISNSLFHPPIPLLSPPYLHTYPGKHHGWFGHNDFPSPRVFDAMSFVYVGVGDASGHLEIGRAATPPPTHTLPRCTAFALGSLIGRCASWPGRPWVGWFPQTFLDNIPFIAWEAYFCIDILIGQKKVLWTKGSGRDRSSSLPKFKNKINLKFTSI